MRKISFTFSSDHNKSGRYVRGPQQWRRYNPQVSIILTTIATCHLRDGIIREFANRRGATLSNTQHTPPSHPHLVKYPIPAFHSNYQFHFLLSQFCPRTTDPLSWNWNTTRHRAHCLFDTWETAKLLPGSKFLSFIPTLLTNFRPTFTPTAHN